jgi:hypothetical protein
MFSLVSSGDCFSVKILVATVVQPEALCRLLFSPAPGRDYCSA